jgi:hypothetical protein
MITLKNLQRNKDIISAEVYPETYNKPGFIAVDVRKEKIVDFKEAPDSPYLSGRLHAMREIIRMKDMSVLPEKRVVLWY